MGRRAARITHDEVCRVVKGVRSSGLSIGRVVFDGYTVSVEIGGDSVENAPGDTGHEDEGDGLILEPKL